MDRRSSLGCLFEIGETLVLTLIIFFVIQNFVAQPYKVQQQSMERTLEPGQYVLVRFGPGSKGMMAAEIGADGYSEDAIGAVSLARQLVGA